MNQQKSLIRIAELLARFKIQTAILNSNAQLDINIVSEDVLIPILNIAYDCNLSNAKYTEQSTTFPALDLLDRKKRIAFQITSTAKIKKVRETIEKIVEHEFNNNFDTFFVYILTQKQESYDKTILETATKNLFHFTEKNVLDEKDLYQKIASLKFDDIRKVEQLLSDQFSDIAIEENSIQDKLKTIITIERKSKENEFISTDLEHNHEIRKTLLDKKFFFEKRLLIASDTAKEFTILSEIEQINLKISECNNNITSLLCKLEQHER